MDANTLKNHCLSKNGAYEDFPFGDDVLVIKVLSKMFALISARGNKLNMSLKCDPVLAEDLRQRFSGITPGYHLNKRHWNTVEVSNEIPIDELFWMIDHSYELVVKSLTKSERDSLITKDCV